MRAGITLPVLAICTTICLVLTGCGGNGNVPGGVVQAQTASTPAILTGTCPSITTTNNSLNTNWLFPLGSMASDCSLTGPDGIPMPSAGTLKNLRLVANVGATDSGTVTVFVNRTATPLACTASATGAAQATCSDTTHQVSVAAGDQVAVQVVMLTGGFGQPRVTLEKQ